jgi:type IV pilus assembly protein PilP
LTFVALFVQLSLLSGCGDKEKRAPAVKKQIARPAQEAPGHPKEAAPAVAQEAPPQETAPIEQVPEPPQTPTDRIQLKRDPFKSFVEIRTVAVARKSTKVQSPLQQYKLEQLKVVGILLGGEVTKALLEDDVGKGYVVRVGDLVGDQEGKIVAIEKDKIVVEESYRDVLGEPKVRRSVKRLYSAEEGENP